MTLLFQLLLQQIPVFSLHSIVVVISHIFRGRTWKYLRFNVNKEKDLKLFNPGILFYVLVNNSNCNTSQLAVELTYCSFSTFSCNNGFMSIEAKILLRDFTIWVIFANERKEFILAKCKEVIQTEANCSSTPNTMCFAGASRKKHEKNRERKSVLKWKQSQQSKLIRISYNKIDCCKFWWTNDGS